MTEEVNGEMCGNMHAFEGKSQEVEMVIQKIILVDEKQNG